MKTIVMGNSGSGKSTLASALAASEGVDCLCLDQVAFAEGSTRRPSAQSVTEALAYLESRAGWVVEGCYGEILEGLLPGCDKLIFLNPGVEACVEHCRRRPWEPSKYASREAQDENFEALVEWVRTYETREDEYGLACHRALFDAFAGEKVEWADPRDYGSSRSSADARTHEESES